MIRRLRQVWRHMCARYHEVRADRSLRRAADNVRAHAHDIVVADKFVEKLKGLAQ